MGKHPRTAFAHESRTSYYINTGFFIIITFMYYHSWEDSFLLLNILIYRELNGLNITDFLIYSLQEYYPQLRNRLLNQLWLWRITCFSIESIEFAHISSQLNSL